MARGSLPKRQRLVGLWLLLSGISLLGGVLFASWLDVQLGPAGLARAALWLGCLSGGLTIFMVGLLLERVLFMPLRHLHAQLARLAANPDARSDHPPEGWLRGLGPDIERIREAWRGDRQRLDTAHSDGARSAARIRQELETLLQVLDMPLLLCDRHRRVMLFNQAAESLFDGHPGLGLGKRLDTLIELGSLQDALHRLPHDGTSRELLLPFEQRWLRCLIRRVPNGHGDILLTLSDATAAWSSERGARAGLTEVLPSLRRHSAGLSSAAEALIHLSPTPEHAPLRQRLEQAIDEEGQRLGTGISELGVLLQDLQRQGERMMPLWSNDLFRALNERLDGASLTTLPIGTPAWLKADAPALLEMVLSLLERLKAHTGKSRYEIEVRLGNKRVYLDIVWRGGPLRQSQLAQWCEQRLERLPLSPCVGDLLRQHDSELWSLADEDGRHARLRLPLPADERVGPPPSRPAPRPEFHDFGIAELPPPDAELAACPLRQLEIVSFDTETTGLELRQHDTIISLGACRIVNARLLADDTYDQRVDPQRPIPPASTAIHGLTDSDVAGAPPLPEVLPRFRDYVGDAVLLAHNAAFDLLALQPTGTGDEFRMPVLDTLLISRALDEGLDGHDLDTLIDRYDLNAPQGARHTALGDARMTAQLWLALLPRLEARGIDTLADLLTLQAGAFDREDASA